MHVARNTDDSTAPASAPRPTTLATADALHEIADELFMVTIALGNEGGRPSHDFTATVISRLAERLERVAESVR